MDINLNRKSCFSPKLQRTQSESIVHVVVKVEAKVGAVPTHRFASSVYFRGFGFWSAFVIGFAADRRWRCCFNKHQAHVHGGNAVPPPQTSFFCQCKLCALFCSQS